VGKGACELCWAGYGGFFGAVEGDVNFVYWGLGLWLE
jgi:hypothetical protein